MTHIEISNNMQDICKALQTNSNLLLCKDVDVKIEDNKLLISSIKKETEGKDNKKEEENHYLLKERDNFTFERRFILPKDANAESVSASFSNGVLTINIEKSPEKKPRSIKIKAA